MNIYEQTMNKSWISTEQVQVLNKSLTSNEQVSVASSVADYAVQKAAIGPISVAVLEAAS